MIIIAPTLPSSGYKSYHGSDSRSERGSGKIDMNYIKIIDFFRHS